MPLNKPNNYDGKYLPYSLKLKIVEDNCGKCPYFSIIQYINSEADSEYGCFYPSDVKDLNSNIREPFLTVCEIVMNTCDFWTKNIEKPVQINANTGDELDLMTLPKHIRENVQIGKQVNVNNQTLEDCASIDFALDCGIRF